MRVFLRVADAKDDPSLKQWVTQLRDISYDVEDVLNKYLLRFVHRDTHGLKDCIINIYASIRDLKARHQIASEIQEIKGRLEDSSKSYERFKGTSDGTMIGSSSSTQNEWWDGRDNPLFLDGSDVVGIEEPKKQLVEWIMSMDDGLDVISVVGMGGLGKTTLVKKAYDDDSVKGHFNLHVWIVASDFKDAEHLLTNLIKKLVGEMKEPPPEGLEGMSGDDMREFIYKFLEKKNYIIVVDDVWDISRWEAIRFAFPKQGSHGCIIITTRFSSIGNAACTETNHVYNLNPLPSEKSTELFYKKAFPIEKQCPPYLELYAESILKRCEGLPLAIVVIGGLLATKKNNSAEEWEMLNRTLGDELEEGGCLNKFSKIFSLSYYNLPYHLKYCFLYLSIFPEGCLLEKWKMIRLWVAEGFVQAKQGATIEEVAEGYLNDLLSRGLIQVADMKSDGRSKTFRIHDLLREFITLKSKKQNIVSIHVAGEMHLPNKIRRLAIQKSIIFSQEKYSSFKCLCTLILVGIEYKDFGAINELIRKCRLLKVLHLEGAPLETIPDEVFKLYHLKHLSLRNTMVKLVPKSIKNLENLETLDLKNTGVTELPTEISKLHRLRHLLVYKYEYTSNATFGEVQSAKAPCNIGDCLSSLQKLCYIDADEVDGVKIVREIGKLTQLRRLSIAKLRKADGMDLCSSIAKLTNLRSLHILAAGKGEMLDLDHQSMSSANLAFLRTLYLRGCLEKVPQWVSSLVGLTNLVLMDCRIREDPLTCLEDLPNLVELWIHDAYVEGLNFNEHGFKKLKVLFLRELKYLKWVTIEKGSMPLLEELTLWGCKLVTQLPQGIEHLSNLRAVDFSNMGDEFVERVGDEKTKRGDDWQLARVPDVGFYQMIDGKWYFVL
ncbi:disease resistance protein rpm1 [Phtheirospermum japonicum]|uniref:Disease resistance protein rpm1 n=1 Tax=Phtheirospermum japonicum TaxID=374723 RepID=A0A830DD23_9LAMI|nr:disease resistance protein rpm1 [Phtheirospermum japonicum]